MKKISRLLILIFALLFVRILDHSVFYNLTKVDLLNSSGIINEDFHLIFLGYSSPKDAKKILMNAKDQKINAVTIVAYYDVIHPMVFLVYNKEETIQDSILWASNYSGIAEGLTEIKTYKFDYCRINDRDGSHSFFSCVLGLPFSSYSSSSITHFDDGIHFSLSEKTCYGLHILKKLKTIYIYYFFFPLILILIIGSISNKGLFLSFLYFIEMLLLFPYEYFGYNSHLYLYSCLGFSSSELSKLLFSFFIWLMIFIFLIMGFKKWRNEHFSPNETFIFLFFLLLPICLRF